MRILFVTSGLTRGGAEGFLVRLARGLTSRGHVCAVAAMGEGGTLAAPLNEAGVTVEELGRYVIPPIFKLRRFAHDFKPDVVQGWMYRGNAAALLAARAAPGPPPLIWSVRQGLSDYAASPWTTRRSISWGARMSRRPYAIVYNAASAEAQHNAFGYTAARTRIIPNGIDVAAAPPTPAARAAAKARLGLPDSAFVVALFARWHPVKNHLGFVRAAGAFAARRPEARFLLAGAGVDAANARLASWIADEGVSDRVLLLGDRSDVAELLPAADLATLASQGEALPNALLEAMAVGIPCVAPDVGDVVALIGTTGVVVHPDDPSALAHGWETLAALSLDERARLGERARARAAERFSLARAVEAFEKLYGEAVGKSR